MDFSVLLNTKFKCKLSTEIFMVSQLLNKSADGVTNSVYLYILFPIKRQSTIKSPCPSQTTIKYKCDFFKLYIMGTGFCVSEFLISWILIRERSVTLNLWSIIWKPGSIFPLSVCTYVCTYFIRSLDPLCKPHILVIPIRWTTEWAHSQAQPIIKNTKAIQKLWNQKNSWNWQKRVF